MLSRFRHVLNANRVTRCTPDAPASRVVLPSKSGSTARWPRPAACRRTDTGPPCGRVGSLPVPNDADFVARVNRALHPLLGQGQVVRVPPLMGSEDFHHLGLENETK